MRAHDDQRLTRPAGASTIQEAQTTKKPSRQKGAVDVQVTTVESVVIPIGEYDAKVSEIRQETGNYGPQFKWQFEVLLDGCEDKALVAWTSTSPSLKGKFVRWAGACLGRQIGAGECLDTDDLVGKSVIVNVVIGEGSDGSEFNKVEAVKPRRSGPAPTPQTAASDNDDPFGDE